MKSLEDIDRELAELKRQRAEIERKAEWEQVSLNHLEAVEIYGRLLTDLRRLEEINHLPPKILEALTDGKGKFNPGLYIKRPKAPVKPSNV